MLPVFLNGLPKQDKDSPFEKACNKNMIYLHHNNVEYLLYIESYSFLK